MVIYDNRPDDGKVAAILESAQSLNHFSELYDKARTELGLPPQGTVEQIRDLNHIVAGWLDNTTPDYLARLYRFKDVMVAVMAAERGGGDPAAAEPLITHVAASEKKPGLLKGLLDSARAKDNGGAREENAAGGEDAGRTGGASDDEEEPAEEPDFF